MGRPIDIVNGAVGRPVDLDRGITITVTCDRCNLDRDDRHPRPASIAGWVAAAVAVEQALHTAAGCPGTLDGVWQLTRPTPDAGQGPQATRRTRPDTWEGVA